MTRWSSITLGFWNGTLFPWSLILSWLHSSTSSVFIIHPRRTINNIKLLRAGLTMDFNENLHVHTYNTIYVIITLTVIILRFRDNLFYYFFHYLMLDTDTSVSTTNHIINYFARFAPLTIIIYLVTYSSKLIWWV